MTGTSLPPPPLLATKHSWLEDFGPGDSPAAGVALVEDPGENGGGDNSSGNNDGWALSGYFR